VPILDIAEDADGTLLLGTDGQGLIRIRQNRAARFLPGQRVYRLLVDSQGTIYAATNQGLFRFSASTTQEQFERVKDVPPECRALTEVRWGKDRGIVTASAAAPGNGLTILMTGRTETFTLQSVPPTATIQSLATTADNTLWIATSQGLISLDKEHRERRFTVADGLADDFVYCLHVAPDNILWAGTRDGFSRIIIPVSETIRDTTVRERSPEVEHPSEAEKRSLTVASRMAEPGNFNIDSFHANDGLSQSTVYGIFMDKEDSLWVATKHGLNQFLDGRFTPITVREGLPSNDTGPVLQTSDGSIYVGTLDSGLARFNVPSPDKSHPLTTADGLPSNRIPALAESPARELFIGSDKGLAVFGGSPPRVRVLPFTKAISTLLFDRAGTLWVGGPDGLFSLPKGQQIPAKAGAISVNAMIERKDGSLAVATGNSVVFLKAHTETTAIECPAPACALYEDADGVLWIGTIGGGLRSFDGSTTRHFSMRDGLFDDDIFAIVPDTMGRLWMACSKGIFTVERQHLLDFAAGKIQRITCSSFAPTTALHTTECKTGVSPGAAAMNDGSLWFSTTHGIMVLNPARLPRRLPQPQVVIEEIAVDGHVQPDIQLASPLSLPAGRKNLAFRYTALSFIISPRIAFRYQLEGFDKSWIDAGERREAYYTNIGPGRYTFRVQALNANSSWADLPEIASSSVAFTISPHFYQHWWFIPALILLCLALAAIAFQLRVRVIRNHMRIVLHERSRIARELHDTLLQGFSGITMEMQALLVRLPDSESRRTLEEIIRDAGVCLREARRTVAGLRDIHHAPMLGFPAMLEATARQLVVGSPIHLTVTPPPPDSTNFAALPANVEFNLMRIAREAITNSIKHSHAANLQVGFSIENEQLLLEIRDDGRGFDVSSHTHHTSVPHGSAGHYGLLGMQERAAEISATLQIASVPNQGTLVSVRVPLQLTTSAAATHEAQQAEGRSP